MGETAVLFIYGTLKRGCRNHGEMAGARWLGTAETTPRNRLNQTGHYPGMVEAEAGEAVKGELFAVDRELLTRLDEFEETPVLFSRRAVELAGTCGAAGGACGAGRGWWAVGLTPVPKSEGPAPKLRRG